MGALTADEAKQDYIAKMGVALGTQYAELWQEVAYLHMKWAEYVEMFGRKESRVELMNKAAPLFFHILQDVLFEDTVLHIARLMDRQRNGWGKERLTLRNLPKLIKDRAAKAAVEARLNDLEAKTAFCRDWRDRHIAHRNLALATKNPTALPLQPASKNQVNDALAGIVEVLNTVSRHYKDSESVFRTLVAHGWRDGAHIRFGLWRSGRGRAKRAAA